MHEPGYESHDPLVELLGADEIVRPRPEFRTATRMRLMAQPASVRWWPLTWPALGRVAVPSLPALVAILLVVTGAVLAAALIVGPRLHPGPLEWRGAGTQGPPRPPP